MGGAGPTLSEACCQLVPAQGQRTSLCQNEESGLAGASKEEKGREAEGSSPQLIRQGLTGSME